MHLHALPISLYCAKVDFALALMGLDVEHREPPGGGYRSAEYRALVPSGTIPALVDGDLVLPESDAIVSYLEEVSGRRDALPGDAAARAKARALTRIIDGRLEAKLRATFPQLNPATRDPIALAAARGPVAEGERLVDALIDATGPFAAGPAPSLADCALLATYAWCDALRPALGFEAVEAPGVRRALAAAEADPRLGQPVAAYRARVAERLAAVK